MTSTELLAQAWTNELQMITDEAFSYSMIRPLPSDWVTDTIWLPESTTKFPGPFKYDLTPYCREIINHLHPTSPTRYVAVMKGSQSGLTAGVVVPGICYIISQVPDPTLFTAATVDMAGRTIAERLDPILRSSKLDNLIRPNVIKKSNNRTGDTKFSKEYAGGTLTALGTNSADSFRMFSARYVFADDFDTAPLNVGQEGDVTKLIEGRQKSYGNTAKTFYISTPTDTGTSQIYKQYQRGTMKKWNWQCAACEKWFPVDFKIECEDGSIAGLVYKLTEDKKLDTSSIRFKTPCCGHEIKYEEKYDLNLKGQWIATNPDPDADFESYYLNDILIPPGFDNWEKIIREWLYAMPPGGQARITSLQAFNNQRLGLPFEQAGTTPKSTELMKNVRGYAPGIIPDKTCEEDGNGKIILITLACDLGGLMEPGNEDVRLDWEIVAHSQSGATYSVDQGSIGTFKRGFEKTKTDKQQDTNRDKWTYTHNVERSVWPVFEEIMKHTLDSESGQQFNINITLIDTGFFEKHAMQFILNMQQDPFYTDRIRGIRGRTDQKYRPMQKDSQPVRKSAEKPKQLYILEVNQLKDDLADNMRLQEGEGFSQPAGFMNYPQQTDGKYSYRDFFSHYEGERRVEERNSAGDVLGYKWVKKHSNSVNHFWDVRVYNLAAPLVFLDLLRMSDSRYRTITWEEFIQLVT